MLCLKSNGLNAEKEVRSVLLPLLVSFAANPADFVFALLTGPLSLTFQLFRFCGSSLSKLVTE